MYIYTVPILHNVLLNVEVDSESSDNLGSGSGNSDDGAIVQPAM